MLYQERNYFVGDCEEMTHQENVDKFVQLLRSVNRPGMEDLLEFIGKTDFFLAPGSSSNHDAFRGGLLKHSLEVYEEMVRIAAVYMPGADPSSLIVVSLLHDLCKADFYKEDTRNVKGEDGVWTKVPYYSFNDKYPLGHGEKSAMLVLMFTKLKMEEVMAIRWHMGGFDDSSRSYSGGAALSAAMEKFPLIALTQMADSAAVYLRKKVS